MITTNQLKTLIIESLNLEDIDASDIDDEMTLFGDDGLGLDSVDSIELVLTIERAYGVKIARSENYKEVFHSINSLTSYINQYHV